MSIRKFNAEYLEFSNGKQVFSKEDELELHCIMARTVLGDDRNDFHEQNAELTSLLTNIHEIILKSKANSPATWSCIDALNKIVTSIQNRNFIIHRLRILPILTDLMQGADAQNMIETVLRMIQAITFGIRIAVMEPYIEATIHFAIDIITSHQKESEKFRKTALSVLINLCYNNVASLTFLTQAINLVDFQKKVSIEEYGILACKTNLVLNDCGHLLSEADIRNFLRFASKELLNCIANQEEATLQHLAGFLRDVSSRVNARHVLKEFDFSSNALDNQDENQCSAQISSLFEIINIVLEVENVHVGKMRSSVLSFAQKHLKNINSSVCSLQTLKLLFDHGMLVRKAADVFEDSNVEQNNAEIKGLESSLMEILHCDEFVSDIMIPVLRLLTVLGLKYETNLLNDAIVSKILGPLIETQTFNFNEYKCADVTMFLQCLVTLSKLSAFIKYGLKVAVLDEKNVHCVVGMALKHGTKEQRSMALELLKDNNHFPPDAIAEIISENTFDAGESAGEEYQSVGPHFSSRHTDVSDEDFNRVFLTVQKACDENRLNRLQLFDFINLYEGRILIQNRKIDMLNQKLREMTREITTEKYAAFRLEKSLIHSTNLAKSLQRSNEVLIIDKQETNKTMLHFKQNLATAYTSAQEKQKKVEELQKRQDANVKQMYELQNTIKAQRAEIETLENEMKETENMRQTIISLMQTKRKK